MHDKLLVPPASNYSLNGEICLVDGPRTAALHWESIVERAELRHAQQCVYWLAALCQYMSQPTDEDDSIPALGKSNQCSAQLGYQTLLSVLLPSCSNAAARGNFSL